MKIEVDENTIKVGFPTELTTKKSCLKIQALPTFPDNVGQKKQSVYDLSDNFLTHNV
jgi:hypothetical protein